MDKCECDRPKVSGAEACETCLDKDGRTGPEQDIISTMRVLGGRSQMAAVVEDLGYAFDEDTSGPGHRKVYRALKALRERGRTVIVEEPDDSDSRRRGGGTTATYYIPER